MVSDWTVFLFATIASTETFFLLCGAITALLYISHQHRHALWYALTTLSLALSVIVLKAMFQVPRAADVLLPVSGYAFPSGHAAGITFLTLTSAYLIRTVPSFLRYALWLLLAALLLTISASRVYFNAHTIDQVLAGIVLGALWALAFICLVRKH